jgi:hypothetical protein
VPQGGPTPACRIGVGSSFASIWPDPFIYPRLGCAVAKEYEGPSAVEGFERGWMFWRSSSDRVYVVYNNGGWDDYPRTPGDIFREGIDPEYTCGPAASPPSPRRGFSKIWCNNAEVRQGLGNAVDREQGYCMDNPCDTFQDFSGGLMYSSVRLHTVYVLFADGTWQKRQ